MSKPDYLTEEQWERMLQEIDKKREERGWKDTRTTPRTLVHPAEAEMGRKTFIETPGTFEERQRASEAEVQKQKVRTRMPVTAAGEPSVPGMVAETFGLTGPEKVLQPPVTDKDIEQMGPWEASQAMADDPSLKRKGLAGLLASISPQRRFTQAQLDEIKKAKDEYEQTPEYQTGIFDYKDPDTGQVYEGGLWYVLRMLDLVPSAVIGTGEAVIQWPAKGIEEAADAAYKALGFDGIPEDKKIEIRGWPQTVSDRITRGEGFTGTMGDVQQYQQRVAPLLPSSPLGLAGLGIDTVSSWMQGDIIPDPYFKEYGDWISASVSGFITDLATPILPLKAAGEGISAVGKGITAAADKFGDAVPGLTQVGKAVDRAADTVSSIKHKSYNEAVDALRKDLDESFDIKLPEGTAEKIKKALDDAPAVNKVPSEIKNILEPFENGNVAEAVRVARETAKHLDNPKIIDRLVRFMENNAALHRAPIGEVGWGDHVGSAARYMSDPVDIFNRFIHGEILRDTLKAETWFSQAGTGANRLVRVENTPFFVPKSKLNEVKKAGKEGAGLIVWLRAQPYARTTAELQDFLNNIAKASTKIDEIFSTGTRAAEARAATAQVDLFTPKEITSTWPKIIRDLTRYIAASKPKHMASEELANRVSERWSAIPQAINAEFKKHVSDGKDRAEAFLEIVFEGWDASPETMLTRYIAGLLGGIEEYKTFLSSRGVRGFSSSYDAAFKKSQSILEEFPDAVENIMGAANNAERYAALKNIEELLNTSPELAKKISFDDTTRREYLVFRRMIQEQDKILADEIARLHQLFPHAVSSRAFTEGLNNLRGNITQVLDASLKAQFPPHELAAAIMKDAIAKKIGEPVRNLQELVSSKKEIIDVDGATRQLLRIFDDAGFDILKTADDYVSSAIPKSIIAAETDATRKQVMAIKAQYVDNLIYSEYAAYSPNNPGRMIAAKLDELRLEIAATQGFDVFAADTMLQQLERGANFKGQEQFLQRLRTALGIALPNNSPDNGLVTYIKTGTSLLLDSYAPWVKGGMLAGRFLPNFGFLTMNHLTAPLIMLTTVGGEAAARAIPSLVFARPRVEKILNLIERGPLGGQIKIGERAQPLTTKDGRTFTVDQLAQMITESNLLRSQARAEVTADVIREFERFSRDTGFYGSAIYRGMFANENVWNRVATMSDNRFRIGVFIDALERGETAQTAARLARESLFDYNSLSQFEKKYINKVIWFWTFARNNYVKTFETMINRPAYFKNYYIANNKFFDHANEGWYGDDDKKINSPISRAYIENRFFRLLVKDKEFNRMYSLNGPPVPMIEALADLVDLVSDITGAIAYSTSPGEAADDLFKLARREVADKVSQPAIQTVFNIFNLDPRSFREDFKVGSWVDPRLMTYMPQDMVELFFEPLDVKDVDPSRGFVRGRQWKVKKGMETYWKLVVQSVLFGGLERTMRDYAPVVDPMIGREQREDMPKPVQMGQTWPERIAKTGGLLTPIQESTPEQMAERRRRQSVREIKGR